MSDETKKNMEGDPGEQDALKDLLNPGAPAKHSGPDANVFNQDIFAAPPPPPPKPKPAAPPAKPAAAAPQLTKPPQPSAAPKPPPAPAPQAAKPPPPPPPPPQPPAPKPAAAAPAEVTDEDVKVVSNADFEQLLSSPAEPASGFAVASKHALETSHADEEDDLPDIAGAEEPEPIPAPQPEPETFAATAVDEQTIEASTVDMTSTHDAVAEEFEEETPFLAQSQPVTIAPAAEDLSLRPEGTPLALKAAKAKEGKKAIEEAKEFIERLDGLDEGFLDVAEVKRGLKALAELILRVNELEQRLESLECKK